MESIKIFWITLFFVMPSALWGKPDISRIVYYNHLFGQVHQTANFYSQPLSTIECGHPIKIIKEKNQEVFENGFFKVSVGPYVGFIAKKYLSFEKVKCFPDKYPRFFDQLSLRPVDMYYWGKLYDQYIYGRSRLK